MLKNNNDISTRLRLFLLLCALITPAVNGQSVEDGEWGYYGGDNNFNRYSPLDQINANNVDQLRILWRRDATAAYLRDDYDGLGYTKNLRSTPLLIDGVLYAPNIFGLVEAFDPATGETIWTQEPYQQTLMEAAGISSRGIAHWQQGIEQRLMAVRGSYLYALNPQTGELFPDFGREEPGRVNLAYSAENANNFALTTSPLVIGNTAVIGGFLNGAGDGGYEKEAAPENIRGFDVRSGELKWEFNVVPHPGEFGYDTWEDGSADWSGDIGSWCCLSADDELGIVYVPLGAPTSAYYGGHRPGDNLFANSLVALDAETGERRWHFQMIHHDLWEYDNSSPPILGDITVNGRTIKAVMQANKNGFVYVFDRSNGEPVWPIIETPVPQSIVEGESTSVTQPIPSKPPAFDRQGISRDDLIDFTPALPQSSPRTHRKLHPRPALYAAFPIHRGRQPGHHHRARCLGLRQLEHRRLRPGNGHVLCRVLYQPGQPGDRSHHLRVCHHDPCHPARGTGRTQDPGHPPGQAPLRTRDRIEHEQRRTGLVSGQWRRAAQPSPVKRFGSASLRHS